MNKQLSYHTETTLRSKKLKWNWKTIFYCWLCIVSVTVRHRISEVTERRVHGIHRTSYRFFKTAAMASQFTIAHADMSWIWLYP